MEENKELNTETETTEEEASDDVMEPETEEPAVPKKNEENKESYTKKKLLNDALDIVESTLATVFVMIMLFTYILHPVSVEGLSMNPTLQNSDRIFMTTVYTKLKYGDIVIINNNAVYNIDANGNAVKEEMDSNPLDECLIKRVIAAGGQTVNINNSDPDTSKWTVEVDGKVINEPYIASNSFTEKKGMFEAKFPFTVPEGYYFVMGDNRNNSSDSRSRFVGLIKQDQIYGKALVRYAPFKKFKFLFNSYKHSSEE